MRAGVTVLTPTIPPRMSELARAVRSVAGQTHHPADHLIVCDHLAEGQVAIRNRMLRAVTTEWIAFLDDDDEFLPHHLDRLLEHAQGTGSDLVYPWFRVHGGTDPLGAFGKPFDPVGIRSANYIPVTHLCRTELAQDAMFPRCPDEWPDEGCADWGFLLRLLDAGATFSHLPEVTWVWHHWRGNTAGKPWRKRAA